MAVTTAGPEETRRVGEVFAGLLGAGDIVLLEGEMGAGKTVFASGVGAGLGVTSPVTSPTFVLVRSQRGRSLAMHHADLWRLDSDAEIADLAIAEAAEEDGVALVEWGEKAEKLVGEEYIKVVISIADQLHRTIRFEAQGPSWTTRTAALARVLRGGEAE